MLLALLVGARQLLNLREVRDLRRNLEEKVEIRTQDLAASQNLLLKTQRMNLVASIGAGLVHDINNLIGAGISYARLLRMNLGQQLPLEPDDISELRGALVKARDLTSQLMAFARDKQGTTSRFNATDRILGTAPLLRILVPKGIALDLDLDEAPMALRADPGQLDQVLVNLVSNAKDATPQGGRIHIRTRPLQEPAEGIGPCLCLEVSDTGSGIPRELLERIFEPLFTTKEPGKGTGLGLSSVKGVVDGMGGRLQVESGIGTGTTFRILIPLA
jgi:signal transduction histidine kinase